MGKSIRSSVKKKLRTVRRGTIMEEPMMKTIEGNRMEALNKCMAADPLPRVSLTPAVMETERPARTKKTDADGMEVEEGGKKGKGLKKVYGKKGMKVKGQKGHKKPKPLWTNQFNKDKRGKQGKSQGK